MRTVIRMRPPAEGQAPAVTRSDGRVVVLTDPREDGHESEFLFDRILQAEARQEDVFKDTAGRLLGHVFQGYNACVLAYGQTGSGKTYSIFGEESGAHEFRGIAPRSLETIFRMAEEASSSGYGKVQVSVSMLEIYMDQVRDLCRMAADPKVGVGGAGGAAGTGPRSRPSSAARSRPAFGEESPPAWSNLDVMEDASGATVVKDLAVRSVASVAEALNILNAGIALRQTVATSMNDVSSRSHTVFTVYVTQRTLDENGEPRVMSGHLNIVDLAGSERLKKSESVGDRLTEARYINQSLSTLGKVALELAKGDSTHVPYRDSKLTRVLKDSLGGNSHFVLLTTLHATSANYDECLNSLHFALRCKSIQVNPRMNYAVPGGSDETVQRLKAEIAKLRRKLESTHTHYQKVLEKLGGPNFLQDLGPVERIGMDDSSSMEGSFAGLPQGSPLPARSGEGLPEAESGSPTRHPGSHSRPAQRRASVMGAKPGASGGLPGGEASDVSAQALIKELREQLAARQESLMALQRRFVEAETAHREDIRAQRRAQKLEVERVQVEKKNALTKTSEDHEAFREEMEKLREVNMNLKSQLHALTKSIPSRMEARREEKVTEAKALGDLRTELEAAHREKLAAMEEQYDAKIANLKEQSQYFLGQQKTELEAFTKSYEQFRARKEREVSGLTEELELLYEFSRKSSLIVEKMESGHYRMRERSGLKAVVVPAKDRPAPLNLERMKHLQRILQKLDGFSADMREEEDPELLMEGGSPSRPASQQSNLPAGMEELELEVVNLRRELGRVEAEGKAEVSAAEREALERQILEELTAHPTIDYIRRLENEAHQYQADLLDARKKVADLRVALASAQRSSQQQGGAAKPGLRRAQSARPLTQSNSNRRRTEGGRSLGPSRPNSTMGGHPPRPFSVI